MGYTTTFTGAFTAGEDPSDLGKILVVNNDVKVLRATVSYEED